MVDFDERDKKRENQPFEMMKDLMPIMAKMSENMDPFDSVHISLSLHLDEVVPVFKKIQELRMQKHTDG